MDFDIECPTCNGKIEINAKETTPESRIVCPSCKAEITFSKYIESKEQRETKELEEMLKNLFD